MVTIIVSIITTCTFNSISIPNIDIFFTFSNFILWFAHWIKTIITISPTNNCSFWIPQSTTWFYIITSLCFLKCTTDCCFYRIFSILIFSFITISFEGNCFLNSSCTIWISYFNRFSRYSCCCTCISRCTIFEFNKSAFWFCSSIKRYIVIWSYSVKATST